MGIYLDTRGCPDPGREGEAPNGTLRSAVPQKVARTAGCNGEKAPNYWIVLWKGGKDGGRS